jgi:hypothetical protein
LYSKEVIPQGIGKRLFRYTVSTFRKPIITPFAYRKENNTQHQYTGKILHILLQQGAAKRSCRCSRIQEKYNSATPVFSNEVFTPHLCTEKGSFPSANLQQRGHSAVICLVKDHSAAPVSVEEAFRCTRLTAKNSFRCIN